VSAALAAGPARSVWLIPTRELQHARLTERDGNANDLYLLLAAEIEREVREHGAPILMVDGSRTIDETVAAVEKLFAEVLAAGACAASASARPARLRARNI